MKYNYIFFQHCQRRTATLSNGSSALKRAEEGGTLLTFLSVTGRQKQNNLVFFTIIQTYNTSGL